MDTHILFKNKFLMSIKNKRNNFKIFSKFNFKNLSIPCHKKYSQLYPFLLHPLYRKIPLPPLSIEWIQFYAYNNKMPWKAKANKKENNLKRDFREIFEYFHILFSGSKISVRLNFNSAIIIRFQSKMRLFSIILDGISLPHEFKSIFKLPEQT